MCTPLVLLTSSFDSPPPLILLLLLLLLLLPLGTEAFEEEKDRLQEIKKNKK